MEKILFTRAEVAEVIGLSLASVELLCKSGQLRAVKIGRSVRIHIDDLQALAKAGTDNRTADGRPLHELWRGKGAQ
jgi:excisionase family DNA binding protein